MTKGATDKLRPSLLPVLRSFNRRVEGRHEETHRYRHQVRQEAYAVRSFISRRTEQYRQD